MKDELEKLFELDDGKTTHMRGVKLPKGMILSVNTGDSEKIPTVGSASVMRGVYKFAKRVQGKAEEKLEKGEEEAKE